MACSFRNSVEVYDAISIGFGEQLLADESEEGMVSAYQ